jgi:Iron/zinc purple acid phosphatase-like protein C
VQRLSKKSAPLRTPQVIQPARSKTDQVVLENYDDQHYGYLRLVVNATQLRIEYHPASDGPDAKTPDDFVTVDLAQRRLVYFLRLGPGASKSDRGAQKPNRGITSPPTPFTLAGSIVFVIMSIRAAQRLQRYP